MNGRIGFILKDFIPNDIDHCRLGTSGSTVGASNIEGEYDELFIIFPTDDQLLEEDK